MLQLTHNTCVELPLQLTLYPLSEKLPEVEVFLHLQNNLWAPKKPL